MPKIKFVHTADLHLDTPFKGLTQHNATLAERLKNATLKSFDNIVDLCINEKVDFILIAGDIFNSDQQSLSAQISFIKNLNRLHENNISSYFVCGNHDPLESWLPSLKLPETSVRFGGKNVEKYYYKKDGQVLADIYGISYFSKETKENLAKKYEVIGEKAAFSIAVLHGTTGNSGSHIPYAPFSPEDIKSKAFDYWALGHIHKHEIINDAHPAIVYPGNPQGRDFGETGQRGCYIVEIESGAKPDLNFVPLQSIRFEEVDISIDNVEYIDEFNKIIENSLEKITEDINVDYILRITLSGRTGLHKQLSKQSEINNILQELNETYNNKTPFVFIDSLIINTSPNIDISLLEKGKDFTSELYREFQNLKKDKDLTDEYINQIFDELPTQVRKELSDKQEDEIFQDSEKEQLTEKAKWILLDQIISDKE
ncbi:MAG: metallophosphoesterase [Bacteroidales bacterium]